MPLPAGGSLKVEQVGEAVCIELHCLNSATYMLKSYTEVEMDLEIDKQQPQTMTHCVQSAAVTACNLAPFVTPRIN